MKQNTITSIAQQKKTNRHVYWKTIFVLWYVIRLRPLPRHHSPVPSWPPSWRRSAPSSSAAPAVPLRSYHVQSPSTDRSLPGLNWKAIFPCPCCCAPAEADSTEGGDESVRLSCKNQWNVKVDSAPIHHAPFLSARHLNNISETLLKRNVVILC